MLGSKKDILAQLQREILPLQGYKPPVAGVGAGIGLGPVEGAFPNGVFPRGAVHEFLSVDREAATASGGLIAGLVGSLMSKGGVSVWIGCGPVIFPPALRAFGIKPDRVIFLDIRRERDILWAMEEALKCEGLAAVVAELQEIGFTASRRLQLAVEQSRVTGFLLRRESKNLNTIACVARWRVTPLSSAPEEGLPGLGFPRWRVELLKVRNGVPGQWDVEWAAGRFRVVPETVMAVKGIRETQRRKTG